ncbi:hypothetical protein pEaSNUABM50_00340 [Erwinia phage pEa_SNUABM_50]|uniref:Uncharacterized protein n=3 Tax=Eneladusvirus BF TaxID=2560751 RepID=A0A7L8ZMX0_9CAUD|nr:hypothetical protein pEaSNUABM12_00343 [Erwinia phage pEa_SNUABM_12]QOI71825.1 hypothetical protein pEaSNUABM47_00341 [Erwinia phage pEa_SNUABM_47]QOI72364.1 hypothetical protein pEaSNUABM50_00340 [Erwinia phage pEa_SNUABM_50]QXO11490.1 hypothetical protein pEaSNUABM19_00344 [Erwinia phage pEa_SNUABM_19]QXO12038.1 hypothetical protein pEaSNUABM44_00342 [Erwinia phage pEa_SNUABM_44]
MIHEMKCNKDLPYNDIIKIITNVLESMTDIDFSIFDHMTDSEDYVEVNVGMKASKDKDNIIFYGKMGEEFFIRICFRDSKLHFVKVIHTKSSHLILQFYVGEKKYLINEMWFDRMEFESKAFQMDTTNELPFSLLDINEIFKIMGVAYVHDNSDSGTD